jgi:hypothetical protein
VPHSWQREPRTSPPSGCSGAVMITADPGNSRGVSYAIF